jgi:N-acetylneuraminate synthase/N,N'-diacetyllegionaminate synthase
MSVLPDDRVFVIMEAGVAALGDVQLAFRQIDAAVEAGADAVKFQAWRTESLVSRHAAAAGKDELGYDWFERMQSRELSFDELRDLQAYARKRGIPFFATPHDEDGLALLVELDVPMLKVGSGEAANLPFLRRIGEAGKPVLIAFGLQADDEARRAVDTLGEAGAPDVIAFHTTSLYPTPAGLASLDRIGRLRDALGVPVGLSDHTIGWHIPLAAVALGARALEKHHTFDKSDPRSLDNAGALEADEWRDFVRQVREVEAALRPADPETLRTELAQSRAWAEQAIVAARPLIAGTVIAVADVAFKRPRHAGMPPSALDQVVGRKLARALEADEQVRLEDLSS